MRVLAIPLLCAAALGLTACGFTPLYADNGGVGLHLQGVEVVAPEGRAGFLVRQQLEDELARNRAGASRYRLTYTTNEARFPRGLRVNEIASEYELDLTVDYQLTDISTGQVVYRGVAPTHISYASADAPYAGIAAQQEGQERAAAQAAILIRLDLARYFARTGEGSARP